jgi:hypothetical protein
VDIASIPGFLTGGAAVLTGTLALLNALSPHRTRKQLLALEEALHTAVIRDDPLQYILRAEAYGLVARLHKGALRAYGNAIFFGVLAVSLAAMTLLAHGDIIAQAAFLVLAVILGLAWFATYSSYQQRVNENEEATRDAASKQIPFLRLQFIKASKRRRSRKQGPGPK